MVPIEPRILRIATGADFVERRNGRGVMVRDGRGYLIREVHGPRGRCTRRNCVQCAIKLLEHNGLYVYPPTSPSVVPPTSPPVPVYPGTGQNQVVNVCPGEPRGRDVTAPPPILHPAQERLNQLLSRLRQRLDHYQRLAFSPNGRRAERVNAHGM